MKTGFLVSGYDDFYSGWLARCLEQPITCSKQDWVGGWRIANETDTASRLLALSEEILIGQSGKARPEAHIIVTLMQK